MKNSGMPRQFWVVTQPTRASELGDILFSCDFKRFALQIRGGLDVEEIYGIYADEQKATEDARRLLANRRRSHRSSEE